jgi:hypothetical protein
MNERVFCKVLIGLMVACLLCVIFVQSVRTSGAAWPLTIALAIGLASNLLYLWLRKLQMLGFLDRHRRLRRLLIFGLLCAPQLSVLFTEWFNFDAHKHPIFKDAVSLMIESDVAKRDLGMPIEIGWSVEGRFGETKDRGDFILSVPVAGSHGQGTMRVVATKTHGLWKIDELTLILPDHNVPESLIVAGGAP